MAWRFEYYDQDGVEFSTVIEGSLVEAVTEFEKDHPNVQLVVIYNYDK